MQSTDGGMASESGGQGDMAGGTTASGSPSGNGVLSDDENVAVLQGELDTSMAVFDGMILDQRSTIEGMEDANHDQGFPGEGGDDAPLFEEGDLAASGGNGEDDEKASAPPMPGDDMGEGNDAQIPAMPGGDGTGSSSESGSNKGVPGPVASRHGAVPDDVKDGSDDDIVARQIREAAMKEKDPVLREKLWDEYRKYKNQSK